jgi:hypothetical protein
MKGRASAAAGADPIWWRATGALERRTPVSRVIAIAGDEPARVEGAAMIVWDALSVPRTHSELVADIARRLECDPTEIADGVQLALEGLAVARLVVAR